MKAFIPLVINRMILRRITRNTDKTSKFGVHGPDLNFPERLIVIIVNTDIA